MALFTQMIMASMVSRRSAEAAAAALYACETRLLGMFEHDDSLARCALRGGGFPKTTIVWPDALKGGDGRGEALSSGQAGWAGLTHEGRYSTAESPSGFFGCAPRVSAG